MAEKQTKPMNVPGISPSKLVLLRKLIAEGKEDLFYGWGAWKRRRRDVLQLDKFECQLCRVRRKRARTATIVHHVKHLTQRPDLALSIWDPDTGERQLLSVCKQCHEDEHPEAQRQFKPVSEPVTAERWD